MNIKLSDIVIDPTIQVRSVESHTVSTYAAAMRAGDIFPALVVEKKTNRLVSGNHRFYAYKIVYGPDYEAKCEAKEYADEAEIIRDAAKDNARHGRPLDTFDKKRIFSRLTACGDSADGISRLLGVPVAKLRKWGEMTVTVVGKEGRKTVRRPEPVKHGLEHLAGWEITEEAYKAHERRDRGIPVVQQCAMLTRWLNNGWVNTENEKVKAAVADLKEALKRV